ncbi:MAG TPA: hypothetical protein EYN91_07120 [Candidatus Melainabacteria bacterium]|nr:hypothetical protein [Candidatus Melainabacteria bacterium]HIN66103.1 hypothetical protein [Candidatus Obscuribacterales bacterium]
MQTSAKGLNLIRHYEGIVTKNGLAIPYQGAADPPGVMTIGWGHKMSAQEKISMKNGITLAAAEELFEKDVASHSSKITADAGVLLTQDQFDALSSFVYNLGKFILTTGNSGGQTTLLKELKASKYEAAALQMHLFCNSDGHFTAGLFYRRLTETLMFLTGELKFVTDKNCWDVMHSIGNACADKTAEAKLVNFYKTKSGKKPPAKAAVAGVSAKAAAPVKPEAAPKAATAAAAGATPQVKFAKPQDAASVSTYSLDVLKSVLKTAGITSVIITSTQRTAKDQARVMYENLVKHGTASQRALYGSNGDKVVDLYAKLTGKKTPTEVKAEMEKLILSIGPEKVSKHCADPKKLNVLDIDPAAIAPRSQAFIKAVSNEKKISRLLLPPNDPAYHVEIPQLN